MCLRCHRTPLLSSPLPRLRSSSLPFSSLPRLHAPHKVDLSASPRTLSFSINGGEFVTASGCELPPTARLSPPLPRAPTAALPPPFPFLHLLLHLLPCWPYCSPPTAIRLSSPQVRPFAKLAGAEGDSVSLAYDDAPSRSSSIDETASEAAASLRTSEARHAPRPRPPSPAPALDVVSKREQSVRDTVCAETSEPRTPSRNPLPPTLPPTRPPTTTLPAASLCASPPSRTDALWPR